MTEDRKIEESDVFLRLPEKAGLDELVLARLRSARDKVSFFESEAQLHQSRLDTTNKCAVNAREEVLYWETALTRLAHPTESRDLTPTKNNTRTMDDAPEKREEPAQRDLFKHLDSDSPNEAPEPQEAPVSMEYAEGVIEDTLSFLIRIYDDTDLSYLQHRLFKATDQVFRNLYLRNLYHGATHFRVYDIDREKDVDAPLGEKAYATVRVRVGISASESLSVLHTTLSKAYEAL